MELAGLHRMMGVMHATIVVNKNHCVHASQAYVDSVREIKWILHSERTPQTSATGDNNERNSRNAEEAANEQMNRFRRYALGDRKLSAGIFSQGVFSLFQGTVKQRTVPADQKLTTVAIIHKAGKRSVADNYRSMSLTCVLCKWLKKLVKQHMYRHLTEHSLLATTAFFSFPAYVGPLPVRLKY